MMRTQRKQSGVVLVWVALLLAILLGFVGLATDRGFIMLTAQQLQSGADASALAGAQLVRADVAAARLQSQLIGSLNEATQTGIALDLNEANAAGGDIVVGWYDRDDGTFTPQLSPTNAVQVTTNRHETDFNAVPLFFGPIFGRDSVDVSRSAIAMVGGGTGAGIITLNEDDPASFYINGNPTVTVNGGDVQVNSSAVNGARLQGDFTLEAPNLNVVGDAQVIGRSGDLLTEIHPDSDPIQDPLAWLPDPDYSAWADQGTVSLNSGTQTISSGYYTGGISMTGGFLTMEPGIYVVDGAGFNISGNSSLLADGVMIFVTGSGVLDLTGTGDITMRPIPDDGSVSPALSTYAGVLFFQDRENTNDARIIGTSGLDLEGTMYFPEALLGISGTSDKLGTQIISNSLEISGNGNLTINYNGQFPAPGNDVFLVR